MVQYEGSGLSRMDFCRQSGLSISTLSRYRRRQEQMTAEAVEGKRWLAVEISGATGAGGAIASGLAIVVPGGRRIEIGRGFDAGTLKQLLAVVEHG